MSTKESKDAYFMFAHLLGGVVCPDIAGGNDRRAVKVAGPGRVGFRRDLRGIPQMARENV